MKNAPKPEKGPKSGQNWGEKTALKGKLRNELK
jgi:hypothetical protein